MSVDVDFSVRGNVGDDDSEAIVVSMGVSETVAIERVDFEGVHCWRRSLAVRSPVNRSAYFDRC